MIDSPNSIMQSRIEHNSTDTQPGKALVVRAADAAKLLGITYNTLARYRQQGTGPRYIKSGPRLVFYYLTDLEDWLNANARTRVK